MNSPASRIWELVEQPRTLVEICAALAREYDVDQVECERDTLELLSEMIAEKLVATALVDT